MFLTACSNDMCKAGRANVKRTASKEAALIEDGDISVEQHKNVVFFAFDSANLTAEGKAALDQSAAAIKAGNVAKITVTGHCSEEGSDAYNYGLGERRANAAAKYLLNKHDVSSTICSYGKAVDFGTSLEHNRRAMVHIGGDTTALGAAPCKLKGKKDVVVKKGLVARVKDAVTGDLPKPSKDARKVDIHTEQKEDGSKELHLGTAEQTEPTFLSTAAA